MTIDEAKSLLVTAGFMVSSEQRSSNDLGWQLRLSNGGIVNIFDTGTFNFQGKCQSAIKAALGAEAVPQAAVKATAIAAKQNGNNKVFVVYGHDETARNHLAACRT